MTTRPSNADKPKQAPDTRGTNEFANKVKSVTEREMILAVRSKFTTLPALQFAAWLDNEVERVHR